MSAHTPGPWEAVNESDPRGQPSVMYRGLVCILSHSPAGRLSVVTDGRSCAPDEWAANAALIAAAPELLEALWAAKQMIDVALPCFDWGKSALSAEAIRLLNETPGIINRAIQKSQPQAGESE